MLNLWCTDDYIFDKSIFFSDISSVILQSLSNNCFTIKNQIFNSISKSVVTYVNIIANNILNNILRYNKNIQSSCYCQKKGFSRNNILI